MPTETGQPKDQQDRGKRTSRRRRWIRAAPLVILVIAIFSGAIIIGLNAPPQAAPAAGPVNGRTQGPADAAFIIVEYGDFGCPTCKDWEQQGVMPRIEAKYGSKIRFMWRDLPIITPESPKAAEAADCAADQDQFWPYHDLLYVKAPAIAVSDLKAYAAQLGLDTAKFNTCLDSGQHAADVQADLQDGLSRGFRATPAFLINNRPLLGPPSFEQLSLMIDSNLKIP
jgi:protein-disulfide isomerase